MSEAGSPGTSCVQVRACMQLVRHGRQHSPWMPMRSSDLPYPSMSLADLSLFHLPARRSLGAWFSATMLLRPPLVSCLPSLSR